MNLMYFRKICKAVSDDEPENRIFFCVVRTEINCPTNTV